MKTFIFFFFAACVQQFVYSQNAASVFNSDSLIYYGLDLSNCRLVGDFGSGDGSVMKNKLFVQWNNTVIYEADKYDLKKAFQKSYVFYDLKPVELQNAKTDETQIRTPNAGYTITPETIQNMVNAYAQGEKTAGIAVVFIVETFDKISTMATVYTTFFDVASKKVLLSQKVQAAPRGGGVKNYWANSICDILINIKDYKYPRWKRKVLLNKE